MILWEGELYVNSLMNWTALGHSSTIFKELILAFDTALSQINIWSKESVHILFIYLFFLIKVKCFILSVLLL